MMPAIELRNVRKAFDDYTAVQDINLKILDGEYVSLLGPSGCGKTTILRMVAGLIGPTEGDILIEGKSVLEVPPEDRAIGYLFQNYALFPHMNVEENVGYGLLVRGDYRAHVKKKTDDMLRLVELLEWAGYMPAQLSGGMQQRVALVRSLAAGFKILFLDEPMSSLDPKIGLKLRYEIKKTAQRLKLTVIHVTHDQADAMSISDRIIVMRRGRVAQVGTPKEIYFRPNCPYVAHFIGESNFLKASASADNTLLVNGQSLIVKSNIGGLQDVVAAIRPEKILFEKRLVNTMDGVVKDVNFLGPTTRFLVDANDIRFTVSTAKRPQLRVGSAVSIYLPPDDIRVFSGIKNLEEELKVL
jgi:ABC-type Fe3+/spermidine/putrescine transport system ATPase subunit